MVADSICLLYSCLYFSVELPILGENAAKIFEFLGLFQLFSLDVSSCSGVRPTDMISFLLMLIFMP